MNLPRSQRSGSLRKLTLQQQQECPLSPMSPNRTHIPLNRVVDEVLKHLMDIIEMLLSEENSNNYIAYMNKMQEMCEQNEKNMMLRLEARLEDFKRDLGDNGVKNKKEDLGVKQGGLRSQRKNITKSILTISKSPSKDFSQQRSTDLVKTATNLGNRPRVQQVAEDQSDRTLVNSMDIQSISARLSEVQQSCSKRIKDLSMGLESRVSDSLEDFRKVREEVELFRIKMEEKLDCSLEALWNVVTDMKADLAALG